MLKRFAFDAKNIWDVGANRGDWTRAALQCFPRADYTLVEPQDHLKEGIAAEMQARHKIRWLNAGAGNQPDVLPLYISAKDQSSSFLDYDPIRDDRRADPDFERNSFVALPPRTGDAQIDAEGFDLRVLQGASDFIGHTEIILAEAAIAKLDFENSARNLINAMDDYGYRLLEISEARRSLALRAGISPRLEPAVCPSRY